MFTDVKMVSRAVEKEIPLYMQNILWFILETNERAIAKIHSFELDIIRNEANDLLQKIVHNDILYEDERKYMYPDKKPIKVKIVVIVDKSGNHVMMLGNELGIEIY